ncbi:MAG: response regulator [Chloroflexota bacterium]
MSSKADTPRHYAYVLRCWETRSLPPDPATQWRFSLENLHAEGDHKFPDLETLTAFLRAKIDEEESDPRGNGQQPSGQVALVGELEDDAAETNSEKSWGAISVLLVEEDDAIRRSLSGWLSRVLPDSSIFEADSDERAIELARSKSPDAILVDVAPPKTNGLETVRLLRSAASSAALVALTMEEPQHRQQAFLGAGAQACVKIWQLRQQLAPVLEELLEEKSESSAHKTVVCIEDEIDMLSLVKFTLERHDINLVTALGGEEGLDAVRRTKPDLVLLDLMMPELDGWEVYQRMKKGQETKDIPVIVLTVLDPHWVQKKGMDLSGIADYVTKPFAPQDLVQRVGRALEVVA